MEISAYTKEPLVFIILLNYNNISYTMECLKSLEKINYSNYKVTVIDNDSSDNSLDILYKYNGRTLNIIESNENLGFTGGNNLGIEYALKNDADYILLLNNDTIVLPDFLNPLIEQFAREPKCGITASLIYYLSDPGKVWYAGGKLNNWSARSNHLSYNCTSYVQPQEPQEITFATGCCMCISREAINKIGCLDDDYFIYCDDLDYSYRATSAGFKIYFVPQSVIYHNVSTVFGENSPNFQYLNIRNTLMFIRKNLSSIQKTSAYVYTIILSAYKIFFLKNLKVKYFLLGLKAYLSRESGKPDLNQNL